MALVRTKSDLDRATMWCWRWAWCRRGEVASTYQIQKRIMARWGVDRVVNMPTRRDRW